MKLLIVASLGVLLVSACKPTTQSSPLPTVEPQALPSATPSVGVLEGHVSIGPLTPVERVDVTPTVPPEMYAALSIDITLPDGATRIASAQVGPDGNYRVELAPGLYLVNIPRGGGRFGTDQPKSVEIIAGQTTRLDIDIDTGIR